MASVLVIVLLTIGVGLYITYPLLTSGGSERASAENREATNLMVRRNQLFYDIRELELDFKTGKLSEGDYQAILSQLKTEAAEVLAKLERAEGKSSRPVRKHAPGTAASIESDVEALIAAARESRTGHRRGDAERHTCPSCNASNPPEARFCNKCGSALAAAVKGTS